jgi:autotransporter-associated beta strand protein
VGGETVSFTGANTYEGGTQLTSGRLSFLAGSLGTVGDITMDGGTLVWGGTNTEDVSSRLVMIPGKTAGFDTGANNVVFATGIGDNSNAGVSKSGTGTLTLEGANSFTGNTTVSNGSFVLADDASMNFVIGFNGTNNRITATTTMNADVVTAFGNVVIGGDFNLDLSSAELTDGNSWLLVTNTGSAATKSFGSTFTLTSNLGAFTENADVHTLVSGNNTWTFTEATGVLSLSVVAGGFDSWAAANIADPNKRGRADDADTDGFTNLQEFLFGTDPDVGNGSLVDTEQLGSELTIRWKELASGATYRLLESSTLGNPWVESPALVEDDGLEADGYIPRKADVTLGAGKNFFRVEGTED